MAQVCHDFVRAQAIVGSPASCARQIEALVATTGIAHLRCAFMANGALDCQTALEGIDLFAREVPPACRTIEPTGAPGASLTR